MSVFKFFINPIPNFHQDYYRKNDNKRCRIFYVLLAGFALISENPGKVNHSLRLCFFFVGHVVVNVALIVMYIGHFGRLAKHIIQASHQYFAWAVGAV